MDKLNFAHNIAGKLLAEVFTTVRLHDRKYRVGQSLEINLRHQPIGIAEVAEVIQFRMCDLPGVIAFIDCGHDAEYLKTMLRRFYKDTTDNTLFDVVAIRWTERIVEVQRDLFTQAWEKIEEKSAA